METLITIATYKKAKTAYFLKERLENEEIACFFSMMSNIEQRMEEVKVQVKEDDVEKAIRVMLRIKEEYGREIEEIEPAGHIRKIIVPVDFSKSSEDAAYYAVHLAQKLNAEIKLLHVYQNPLDYTMDKSSATFEIYKMNLLREEEKKAKTEIIRLTDKIRGYITDRKIENVKIHSSIVMGSIIHSIKGMCRIYNPDFIVLGTAGRKDTSKSVLAGLADAMITGLGIPVYAVPGPRPATDFEKVNILYATDFNESDHTSLNRLLKIMEPFDKKITCIHIDTEHNPAKEERMDELNDFLIKDYGKHEIQCRLIEDKDVFHGIRDFADTNRINLLSFTIRKRGIFEKLFKPNLFRKILQESNLPILIFPS